ncbi:hypothetical protein OSH39_19240 [Mycobacterium ulcerans]|uniref:Uncharacterized protein n=1 Tax=Mycobacterium ulcerans TaxID=1809 RepID=A0ABY3VCB5_MYCUL|nr:hypothetical protein [Mycobacterium ulcerans]MEB3906512.1 hypothetical protein [Mycobacterium ulcerans]MEB3910657.1 hypothetical protein [Mycobacterium ulcerans]MEB3920908.1 hypothetical protein [Mycobacterium ulcerans]MEB3925014.1 hypothetical protein [Mycobacterium ulcerans]MEB3929173.1 hypothetical protein [Mycobacterium ulcerans]
MLGPVEDALADAGGDTVLADRLDTARRNARRCNGWSTRCWRSRGSKPVAQPRGWCAPTWAR